MSSARRVAAIIVVSVSWALSLVAIVMTVAFELPILGEQNFTISYLLSAIVYGPVSALLLWYRADVVAVVLSVMAVGSAISTVGAQYAILSVSNPALPWTGFTQHVLDRLWLPGTLASFCFLPLLLTRRPVGRFVTALCVLGATASTVPLLATVTRQRPGAAPNPFAIHDPVVEATLVNLFYGSLAVVVALSIVTGVILIWRFIFGRRDERAGLGWLIIGHWLLVLFFNPSLMGWFPNPGNFLLAYAPFALPIAQLFMPAAILVLALGQRMWGLDVALNRALVWILLIAALLVAYASVALVLSNALPVPPTIAGVIGVGALALAIDPLRRWIQRRVDSLVYGDAAEPAQLMRALGSRLPGSAGGTDLQALVDALLMTLRLGYLSVRSTQRDATSVQAGTLGTGPLVHVVLRNANEAIGDVTAGASGSQKLDRRTTRVLEDIAGVLAVALQLSDANLEARQARESMLRVRDEERRMVRRELHDGLAPSIAATVADLDTIPAVLNQPRIARERIAVVRDELAQRTNDVRDLARTLLPGSLDSGDLRAALSELVARFETSDLAITLDFSGPGDLDSTRQAAIYHITAEAVLLSRRSAGARRVTIAVEAKTHDALIRVTHDGDASGADTEVVLASIRDRADDLGGDVVAEADETGLRLEIEVPS